MTEPLTDKQITALINDPALIMTHDVAREVLGRLNDEIASIQAQIDAATIEANARPLPSERQAWLIRASYAAAMRKRAHRAVMQRDREIRGTKGPAQTPLSPERQAQREVGLAKNVRLKAEAEARVAKRQHQVTIEHRFFEAAKLILPKEKFQEILKAAELAGHIK